MVRHTTTRRTQKDLVEFADAAESANDNGYAPVDHDHDRFDRFVAHGWATPNGPATGKGTKLAGVCRALQATNDLADTVDIMGVPAFVDAANDVPQVDAPGFFAGVRTVVSVAEEAFYYADGEDNYATDYDPTPSFTFDGTNVEVAFETKRHAKLFTDFACRFDPTRKHDERFSSNQNPRRFVVDPSP